MYESYFCLPEPAFSPTPDPRFLWLSGTHEEGLAALRYGIARDAGFILLTGGIGAGKTTLLRAALRSLSQGAGHATVAALVLSTTGLTSPDLVKLIAAEYRLGVDSKGVGDLVVALRAFLLARHRSGWRTVLVIDEAQTLQPEIFEELRLLSNLQAETEGLLQVVLTGPPELRERLALPSLRRLRERIAVDHHVDPLQPGEIGPYLRHRIGVAGGRYEKIFAAGADLAFAAFCCGCPRMINLLADRVLLAAYARQRRPISAGFVARRARELAAARAAPLVKADDGEF
jgi:general secretion pathway protein A